MPNWRRAFSRLRTFLRPSRAERDLAREVDAHLALIEEDFRRRGLSSEEARLAARRAFGGIEQAKEAHRDARSFIRLEQLRQDVRYACRSFARTPGFTIVVILTLALGVGAASAIFTFADASLIDPLPFPDADRLVTVNEVVPLIANQPIRLTAPDLVDYEQQTHVFAALGGWQARTFELSGAGESERVQAARVTAGLFDALQVQPRVGRTFTATEDRDGVAVCVISDGLWRRRFGADPMILGRTVDLDRRPYKVVGVMPRAFEFPLPGRRVSAPTDVWVPMSFTAAERQDRFDNWSYSGIARLKPGVTIEQGSADVNAVARRIVKTLPAEYASMLTFTAVVQPLDAQVSETARPLVLVLFGAAACLLLIACVNVVNLLLARGARREWELAVRVALGAGRGRLLRQLLLETLLLALASAVAGGLLGVWSVDALSTFVPARLGLLARAHFNWHSLVFVAGIAIALALAVGMLPGWVATARLEPGAINERGAADGGVRHRRLRSSLVAMEVAMALTLLIGAGLLTRSFQDLLSASAGFEPQGAVAASIELPSADYPDAAQERHLYRDLINRLRAVPSVTLVGIGTALPLSGRSLERNYTVQGYVPPPGARMKIAGTTIGSGDYLQALGTTLVHGRYFTAQDDADSSPVVIVTRSFARDYWPDSDPIGQHLKWGSLETATPWETVVGVVDDVKTDGLGLPAGLQIFLPAAQIEDAISPELQATSASRFMRNMFVVVRGSGSGDALAADIRAVLHGLDSRLAVAHLQTLTDVVSASAAPQRFDMLLMGGFALMALLLAAIGVYGVISYSVAQRTQEIGVRMALGADARSVLRLILGGGLRLTLIGVAIGAVVAALCAPLVCALLFGVKPLDAPTFIGAALVLLAVAILASYVPARRAARVDPQRALRSE